MKGIEDDDFMCSIMVLSTTVADEGEEKETCYIPLMYLIGWIFTDYVSRNTRPGSVMELHKALYDYLERRSSAQSARLKVQEHRIEKLKKEIAELEQYYEEEAILDEEVSSINPIM
jgi:ribosomal protein L29